MRWGRQCASGGHEIGEKIAQRLGIAFYDKKGLMEIAGERYTMRCGPFMRNSRVNSLLYALAMGMDQEQLGPGPLFADPPSGGSGILRDHWQMLRLYFPPGSGSGDALCPRGPDMRIERVMKYEGISRREAEKLVDKTDEDRAAFYQYYTRRQWGHG